jgi:nifR3 family TIM-barrel protein
VTLKTRLGWNDDVLNAPELARRAEAAGIQMLTIHGRTRCQFYKGHADWAAIRDCVDAVDIPVIANGDIISADAASVALEQSGAAGVMVGRGAQGKPWLLARIAAHLTGQAQPEAPTGTALADLIIGHYQAMLSFYGVALGVKTARKHLGWYMDLLEITKPQRHAVLTETNPDQTIAKLRTIFANTPQRHAA